MSRRLPLIILLVVLSLWLAASYGLRYALMEDGQWVGLCAETPSAGSANCAPASAC